MLKKYFSEKFGNSENISTFGKQNATKMNRKSARMPKEVQKHLKAFMRQHVNTTNAADEIGLSRQVLTRAIRLKRASPATIAKLTAFTVK